MELPPSISIAGYELEAVHEFVFLSSMISDSLSPETEIKRRIGKVATTLSRLTKTDWSNRKLTKFTKLQGVQSLCKTLLLQQ